MSEFSLKKVIFPNNKRLHDFGSKEIADMIYKGRIEGVYPTIKFQLSFEQNTQATTESQPKSVRAKKTKVFIVHGRDKAPALELKDFLKDTYKLDVVIFDDIKKKRTSPTIIELLEDIVTNAGYAFVVATPDDLGAYCKDVGQCKEELLMDPESINVKSLQTILSKFRTRARQNVVFEHGLFLGALGRDKVCCLLEANTQDKQTDIDGIVYVSFKENISETFPEIVEKLKDPKIGLIKP